MDQEQNQDNNQSQRRQHPEDDQEHETHTLALVLLVLASLVIIVVIISVNEEMSDLDPGTYDDEVAEPIDEKTHGAGIPVEKPATTQQNDLSEFPESLEIPEEAQELQNYRSPFSENLTQHVYLFQTQNSLDQLISSYSSFFEGNERFQPYDVSQSDGSATIQSQNADGERLLISISSVAGAREVQINYIKQTN